MNSSESNRDWCSTEFSAIDFGDKRINERFVKTAEFLSRQPTAPINKACDSWADTKAAYRLFNNEKVSGDEIFASHRQKTLERVQGHSIILAVQDTSLISYDTHRSTKGLGKISGSVAGDCLGLIMHTAIAVSEEGLSLGLLDQQIYSRAELPVKQKHKRKNLAIQDKESYKWIKALEGSVVDIPKGTRVIMIGDRESDIYELFTTANRLGAGFVVRAFQDRILQTNRSKHDEQVTVWERLNRTATSGRLKVEVVDQKTREPRIAVVTVRHTEIKLKAPQRSQASRDKNGKLPDVTVYAIYVKEPHPPKGVEALEWMLLTNEVTLSFKDAVGRIKWYRMRWHIEVYHKVLKSGCSVEECRLETAPRLKRFLSLKGIVAWRLYWMTHIGRSHPDLKCTTMLAEYEWKALYMKVTKSFQLPKVVPTIREAIRWIAQLGGFLARKGDGEPGIITVWRGWQRLTDIADAYLMFNGAKTCG